MRTATLNARPAYGLGDIIGLLIRQLPLMILIFLLIVLLGTGLVLTVKKTYKANATILAQVSQEYVYQPRVGRAEQVQAPNPDQVAQSEAAILRSQEVKRRALRVLGNEVILGPAASELSPAEQETAALKVMGQSLDVWVAAGSPVISLSYESHDALVSARVLNALIDQYLIYRRELFQDRTSGAIASQREAFEADLNRADGGYETFLQSNNIGDFVTTKAAAAAAFQSTYAERLTLQAQLNQATQRLATLRAQQSNTPAEIVLQQDLNVSAQDQILQLRTEREQLLSRYQPDSQPVREIEERIIQLQDYVDGENTVGVKEVRTGPNTIWTQVEGDRINAEAERDSLAARLAVVDRQLGELRGRLARLTALESTNANLSGNREVLAAQIREFQLRESQARADAGLVAAGADTVNVLEHAAPPTEGKSLKLPMLAAVILFAGFTALCIGLLRIFLRRGFVTPASAGRTLDMPVLAVAPVKPA